jgi:hypothetical protein
VAGVLDYKSSPGAPLASVPEPRPCVLSVPPL